MYILEIAPIKQNPSFPLSFLSYFSGVRLPPGALVEVDYGRQVLRAVVFQSSFALRKKIYLKQATFKTKNIKKVLVANPIFSSQFLKLIKACADHYFAPPSFFLKFALPPSFVKNKKLPQFTPPPQPPISKNQYQTQFILGDDEERFRFYRQIFKKLKSDQQGLIVFHNIKKASFFKLLLNRAKINSVLFVRKKRQKEYFQDWQEIAQGKVKVVVGVKSAPFAPFWNLKVIIVDRIGDSAHQVWEQKPRFNAVWVAQKLAEISLAPIYFGDIVPNSKIFFEKIKIKKVSSKAYNQKVNVEIINLNEGFLDSKENKKMFSQKLFTKTHSVKKAIFYINRLGEARYGFCKNCALILKCQLCNVPMVWYGDQKIFFCRWCGQRQPMPAKCSQCHFPFLQLGGLAVQKVENFLKKEFPKIRVFRLDSTNSEEQNEKFLKNFQAIDQAFLVTTEILFSQYQDPKADLVAILRAEQSFFQPDYSVAENFFRTSMILKQMAQKEFIIQTFNPDRKIFKFIKNNDFLGFYQEEVEARKNFILPPSADLIKITHYGNNYPQLHQNLMRLKKHFSDIVSKKNLEKDIIILGPVAPLVAKRGGRWQEFLILKIKKNKKIKKIVYLMMTLVPQGKNWSLDVNAPFLF